jgi:hypothetical protein
MGNGGRKDGRIAAGIHVGSKMSKHIMFLLAVTHSVKEI